MRKDSHAPLGVQGTLQDSMPGCVPVSVTEDQWELPGDLSDGELRLKEQLLDKLTVCIDAIHHYPQEALFVDLVPLLVSAVQNMQQSWCEPSSWCSS